MKTLLFKKRVNQAKMRAMLRDEFLITMQKFVNHIDLTIRQIEGKILNEKVFFNSKI